MTIKKKSNFQIKDDIDNIIYHCFNITSDIIFSLNFHVKKLIKLNKKYENIHFGERCFILGTGPSLNQLTKNQIIKLNNEVVFGVNSLFKANIVSDLTPHYYSLFDNLYLKEESHFFEDIINKYKPNKPVFITDYRTETITKKLGVNNESIYLYNKKYPVNKIKFNITQNMYIGINVVSTTILTAIYMGFKEIYLLGCDYNSFATIDVEHCYQDYDEKKYNNENLAFYLKFYAITTKIHYLIEKCASKQNIKIINVTPNSLLDAYLRKDISSVL